MTEACVYMMDIISQCLFFFQGGDVHRDLHLLSHSFPTLRSSDLLRETTVDRLARQVRMQRDRPARIGAGVEAAEDELRVGDGRLGAAGAVGRSEEHTFELQSLMSISSAVYCLKEKIRYRNHVIMLCSKANVSPTLLKKPNT